MSGVSHRSTSSSNAVDPHRSVTTVPRRATVARVGAQPVSSYSSSDTGGGVGESPMPPQRLAQNTAPVHRVSITNLFSFSGSNRKSRSPPSKANTVPHPGPSSETQLSPPKSFSPLARTNSHTEGKRDRPRTRGRREKPRVEEALAINPHKTTEEAYFDSYYSTLIGTPKADDQPLTRSPDTSSQKRHQAPGTRDAQPSQAFPSLPAPFLVPHPYAHVPSTVAQSERPTTGQSSIPRYQEHDPGTSQRQKPTVTQPPILRPSAPNSIGRNRQLRASVSSPDLYAAARMANASRGSSTRQKPTFANKDRWLAIETWCDAVVFPRPRFYVKQGDEKKQLMVITPPDTPIAGSAAHHSDQNGIEKIPPNTEAVPAFQSRVLLHSRSQQDLRLTTTDTGTSSLPVKSRRRGATLPNGSARQYPLTRNITSDESGIQSGQPRPSVQDRARSPSPVLSLSRWAPFSSLHMASC